MSRRARLVSILLICLNAFMCGMNVHANDYAFAALAAAAALMLSYQVVTYERAR